MRYSREFDLFTEFCYKINYCTSTHCDGSLLFYSKTFSPLYIFTSDFEESDRFYILSLCKSCNNKKYYFFDINLNKNKLIFI